MCEYNDIKFNVNIIDKQDKVWRPILKMINTVLCMTTCGFSTDSMPIKCRFMTYKILLFGFVKKKSD